MTNTKLPARRRGVAACLLALAVPPMLPPALSIVLPLGVVACSGQDATTVDYESLIAASRVAYTQLAAEADALAAAGKIDKTAVATAEAAAQIALAALAAPVATSVVAPAAGTVRPLTTVDLASLQAYASDARLALQTLAAVIPAGVLPASVTAAMQLAIALLNAFIGLDAVEARASVMTAQAHALAHALTAQGAVGGAKRGAAH